MKKKRLKDLMKFAMLLFGISLITTNCNKDDLSSQTEALEITTGYKSIKISSKEIKTNSSISKILEKLKENESDNNTFNKEVYDSINDFTIETDEAIYITNEGYHSYTFSITRTIDNGLTENLLLSLQADQSYKAYIVEYTLTAVEKEQLLNGNSIVDLQNKVTYTLLNDFDSAAIFSKDPRCYEYLVHESPWGPTIVEEIEIPCPPVDQDNTIDAGDSSTSGDTPDDSSPVGDDNTGNNTTTGTTTQTDNDPGSDTNSGGGDASNPDSEANGDNTTAPTDENCIMDANGNCIGNATTPKIKNTKTVDEKNCEELQKLLGIPNYPISPPLKSPKQAIAHLKSLISDDIEPNNNQERGYDLLHNSSLEARASWATNTSFSSISYKFTINNYGGLHLHPNDGNGTPFFSPEDILNLWRFSSTYNNGTTVDPSLFVHVMVSTKGVYALKIDDPIVFSQLSAIYNDYRDANEDGTDEVEEFSKPLKNAYERFIDPNSNFPTGSDSDYQRAFLKFMNNFDNTGSKIGISLYKADNNLTTWSKLTLNENTDIITPTPCN